MRTPKLLYTVSAAGLLAAVGQAASAEYEVQPFAAGTGVSGSIEYSHGNESGGTSLRKKSAVGEAVGIAQSHGPLSFRAESQASAGQLGARAETTFDADWAAPQTYYGTPGVKAGAGGSWTDTITITGGTGLSEGSFRAHLGGTLKGGNGYVAPYDPLSATGVRFSADYLPSAGPDGWPSCGIYGFSDPCSAADFQHTLAAVGEVGRPRSALTLNYDLATDFTFEYGTPFRLSVALDVSAADGGLAEFGSAALFGLELPEGAVLRSESGFGYEFGRAFGAAPVPEPASYAMTALGLVLMSLARRLGRGREVLVRA